MWFSMVSAGFTPAIGFIRTLSDVSIVVAAAAAARRLRPVPLRSANDAWVLIGIAASVGLARVLVAFVWSSLGLQVPARTEVAPITLGASAVIGTLVFLPLLMLLVHGLRHVTTVRRHLQHALPMLVILCIMLRLVFLQPHSEVSLGLAFLVIPVIAMFAAQLSQIAVAIGLTVLTFAATYATMNGLGPFAPDVMTLEAIKLSAFNVQVFLLALPASGWLLAGAVEAHHRVSSDLAKQVEQRTRTAEELARSEERFRRVLYSAPIPMSFSSMDQGLGEINDARCAFHERTREELATMDWRDLTHPDDIEREEIAAAPLLRGDVDHYEIRKRYLMPDGRVKWGDLTIARAPGPLGEEDYAIAEIVDVTAEVEARLELQQLVDTDLVTGLRSRGWMTAELRRQLAESSRLRRPIAVMFIDLTEFLVVNRTLGYGAGDEILVSLAHAVTRVAPEGYSVGRFDGHNFVVIVPEVEDIDAIEMVAHDMLTAIAGEIVVRGQRISRTGSIGIAVSSRHSTATSMLRDADLALVTAKAMGRSRVHVHVPSFGGDAEQAIHLEHELREALDGNEFVVYYQPQVWLDTGLVCGYEALVRWDHPERGVLLPSLFMQTMESSGLVIQLGHQVLAQVCRRIATTSDLLGPISVNVSAVEFADADWFDVFARTVRESGIRPELLVVELTETTVLNLTDDAAAALAGVRALGIGVHIDDFGTGYASVGMLQSVPVTALKLDRSFIVPIQEGQAANVALLRGIAGLAEGMGLETIAEGIESAEQAELLRQAGWHVGQGFLFGRPAPDLKR